MSFEIKQKTQVKVKLYGEEFELRKPTVSQVKELSKKTEKAKKTEDAGAVMDSLCEMLDVLGLPKEFSKDMEVDHLIKLVEYLQGEFDSKKK